MRSEVEVRRPLERVVGGRGGFDAGHAIGEDALARARHQVPDAALQDEAERADAACAGVLAGGPVAEVEPDARPDRLGHRLQGGQRIGRAEPARRIEMEARGDPLGRRRDAGRQGGEQLQARRLQHVGEAELRGGPRQAGQEQRLGRGGREACEVRAVAVHQAEAARAAPLGVDRHAGRRQLVDVAMDGAFGNLELGGELARAQPPAGLQQHEDGEQPAGLHDGAILTGNGSLTARGDAGQRARR
jgi:hypothetical protein